MAEKLKEIFRARGIPFFIQSPTNQQFVVLENGRMEKLARRVAFSFWEKQDDTHTVVRFVTGWSTSENDLLELDRSIEEVIRGV